MPDFTPFDVSVGTKSSPECTSFVFSNGNYRQSSRLPRRPVCQPGLHTCVVALLPAGPGTCSGPRAQQSSDQEPITSNRDPPPCRRCLEVKYSLILVASAAVPSRAGSSLWIYRHFESPSPAGARRWEVGIAPPPPPHLLAGTPTAGRELQPEQPPESEPSHMFRAAAPPVSA